MGYTKEQKRLARYLKEQRFKGDDRSYALIPVEEILESRIWLAKRNYENKLMQECIADLIGGLPPCKYCEEYKDCNKKQKNERGCKSWWLRFLTEEEDKACEKLAQGVKDDQ